jgi:hypothetical protein
MASLWPPTEALLVCYSPHPGDHASVERPTLPPLPSPYGLLVDFSIKLARSATIIRASSGELRASAGSREARARVSTGRAAAWSRVRPVRFYATPGTSPRRSTTAARGLGYTGLHRRRQRAASPAQVAGQALPSGLAIGCAQPTATGSCRHVRRAQRLTRPDTLRLVVLLPPGQAGAPPRLPPVRLLPGADHGVPRRPR